MSTNGQDDKLMRVGYWSIRGLGAPCRMMTMYAGVKVKFDIYDVVPKTGGWDASSWFTPKKELKKINPLMNLPYVIDGDIIVNQTNAVLTYLGRKLGLWGKSPSECVACEQLLVTFSLSQNVPMRIELSPHHRSNAYTQHTLIQCEIYDTN